MRPERRRELVRHLEWTYRVSERRGCAVLRFNRSSHRYRAIRNDQAALTGRIRELAAARVRYGYFRIYILLRREGWKINHKRVYWIYCDEAEFTVKKEAQASRRRLTDAETAGHRDKRYMEHGFCRRQFI